MSKEFDDRVELCLLKEKRTPEEEGLLTIEFSKCMGSFLHFLKWVKIIEPPTQTNPGGLIPFEFWEHIKVLIKIFLTQRLISVLKSRQIGLSYIASAYVLWYSLAKMGSNWELFSKGELEAQELLGKAKRIYRHLPLFMRLNMSPTSEGRIGFPSMESIITAFGSTESSGISFTCSGIVWDEHEEHPYAPENFNAAKPAIDSVNGQAISIFTVNKQKPETLAKSLFKNGKIFTWDKERSMLIPEPEGKWGDGNNGFISLFFPYDVVPGRDVEWYEDKKRNLNPEELRSLSPELYMEQNYPRSIEEALSRSETVAVFDKKVLNNMMGDVRGKINEGWEEIDNDICHIYKDYHVGNFYIAASDVSLGVGGDFNVTCILDVKTGDIVADILSKTIPPEELAYHSVNLLRHYHSPLWWPEANLYGRTVIKKAIELGYKRFGYRGDKSINWNNVGDDDLKRIGFFTDEKHRGDLFGALIPAINDYQIKIYNQAGLKQFFGIIRNADKQGKIEAMSSQHDDYVIAVGICWLKKGDVRTSSSPIKPIETLTWDEKHPSVIQGLIDKQLQGVSND